MKINKFYNDYCFNLKGNQLKELQNLLAETTRELEIAKGQLQERDQKLQRLEQLEGQYSLPPKRSKK